MNLIMKYTKIKMCECPRCKCTTKQILFDYKYMIYKCSKCNNIHA